jgi:hypothetical protein
MKIFDSQSLEEVGMDSAQFYTTLADVGLHANNAGISLMHNR